MKKNLNLVLVLLFLFISSCEEKIIKNRSEVIYIEDICSTAQSHISDCTDLKEDSLSGECDNEAAEIILNTSCQDLNRAIENKKSDGDTWLDKMHCRIGVLHFCHVPVCEEIEEVSSCIDTINLSNCGQCSYYNCLEEKAQCGGEGYLMNFVGKYCNRFTQVTRPRLSEFGKVWLDGVRECLIYNMEYEYYYGESCESIEDRGIKDHINCYVDTGICSLPTSDWLKILGTIKPQEFPLFQAISVGNKCVKDFLNL